MHQVLRSGERLFIVTGTELVEISVKIFSKPLLVTGKRWPVMTNATNWFRGVGISDLLGSIHLVVPFSEAAVAFVKVPELDKLRVVGAIAGTRFVEVMTIDKNGQYKAIGFSFDSTWQKYSATTRDSDSPEQNTAILDKGVTATIAEDGELVIAVPWKGEQKEISDKDLFTTMRLGNIDNRVVYRKDGALWSLRMQ